MVYGDLLKTYKKWEERMLHHGVGNMPFCVAFCGVFSSGKSSLLNALLGYGDVLPKGINPVTKIITRIRYGETMAIRCVMNGYTISIPKKDMRDVITGKQALPEGCTELIVELPSRILRHNVEFLDTPGYDDNAALEDMSREAALSADYIVFCCNSTQLGKQFEKQYLQELKLTHGNFCMVVNRMDSLNTDEDVENVRRTAKRLMSGCGIAAHPEQNQGRFFLTIADGEYTKIPGFDFLNGFDKFIQELVKDTQEKKTIRQSTNACFTSYFKDRMFTGIKEEKAEYRAELKHLQAEDTIAQSRIERQKQANTMRYAQKLDRLQIYGDALIRKGLTNVENGIKNIRSAHSFSKEVNSIVYSEVSKVLSGIWMHADIPVDKSIEEQYGLSDYLFCDVPEPVFKQVQRRGLLGRTLQTLQDSWDAGTLIIDDGKEWATNDYKSVAISVVNRHFQSFLEAWKKFISAMHAYVPGETESFSPNPRIAILQAQLDKIQELEAEIQVSFSVLEEKSDPERMLAFITRKINLFHDTISRLPDKTAGNMSRKLAGMQSEWENGRFKVVLTGPGMLWHGCGVLNALLRKDWAPNVFITHPTPFEVIPFQAVESARITDVATNRTQVITCEEFFSLMMLNFKAELEEKIDFSPITVYTQAPGLGTAMISFVYDPLYWEWGAKQRNEIRARGDVIVYVMNAATPLLRDAEEFIQTLYSFENLFVVFDRMEHILENNVEDYKKEMKGRLANIIANTGRSDRFVQAFLRERVFFTSKYDEDIPIGRGLIRARIPETGVPELRSALRNHLISIDSITKSVYPLYRYMCQLYGTLTEINPAWVPSLADAWQVLNSMNILLYGYPLTERLCKEIANSK